MGQSRRMSMVEACANVIVGFWIAVAATEVIFPLFGIPVAFKQNLLITSLFTVISLLRSFAMRRFFNWVGR